MWLVRIGSAGNLLWERSIGGANPYGSSANDVAPTPDGGFITAGETFNDIGGDKTVPWLGSGDGWVVKLRSESDSCDDDNDGVLNDRDQCPNTPAVAVVNAQGCSVAQLCPCHGPWRNHGEYVQCVMNHAWEFYRHGLINEHERQAIIRAAVRSDCGRNHDREAVRIHLCPQTREECQRDGIRVVLSGDVAGEHIIESSTDLINGSPVEAGKVTVIGDEILFPVAPNVAARFYRIRTQ